MSLLLKNEDLLLNKLKNCFNKELQKTKNCVVAFDADGTLWKDDTNEILLEYQHRNQIRELSQFLKNNTKDTEIRANRCVEFAKKQCGFSLEEFRAMSQKALTEKPIKPFFLQKELLKYFKENNLKIYIVTASIKWLVEEALKKYDLPFNEVLGVHIKPNENGILTNNISLPITFGEGKKEALLTKIKNKDLLFMTGNTISDLPLLKFSKIKLVINSSFNNHENFSSEQELKHVAKKEDWFFYQY